MPNVLWIGAALILFGPVVFVLCVEGRDFWADEYVEPLPRPSRRKAGF